MAAPSLPDGDMPAADRAQIFFNQRETLLGAVAASSVRTGNVVVTLACSPLV